MTASCTNGATYVWDTTDTTRSDRPLHILRHGEPVDEYHGDREREDVGVKFAAWGTAPDRFYTGSSDGVVKVWNIRSLDKRPFVRNLLEAPAPITAGMFCPNKSRLVVGDASGRVFMLSVDEEKEQPMLVTKVPLPGGQFRTIRRPPAIAPHPDLPPPIFDAQGHLIIAGTGQALGHAYLANEHLKQHPNPTIGAVQGPRYVETGLFRREMHFREDPMEPLLARWEAMQQEAWKPPKPPLTSWARYQRMALGLPRQAKALERLHLSNREADLDWEALAEDTWLDLQRSGVDFAAMTDYLLEEEV